MRTLALFVLLASGCLTPVPEGQQGLAFETWCAERSEESLCHARIGCRVADPQASCADIGATRVGPNVGCEPALVAAVDAGRVRYDGVAQALCRERTRSTCDLTVYSWDCTAAFTGTLAEGRPCALDLECQTGLRCAQDGGCEGTCAPRLPLGSSATRASSCESARLQPQADGGSVCASPASVGQSCSDRPCALELACVGAVCVRPLSAGASCDESVPCVFGTACVDGRCTAFATRDAPCAAQFFSGDAGLPDCQFGLACRAGRCGGALAAGESCREEPNRCAGGSRCDLATHTCLQLGAVGAACVSTTNCDRLSCVGGACGPGVAPGASCDAARPCAPWFSCVNGACAARACF